MSHGVRGQHQSGSLAPSIWSEVSIEEKYANLLDDLVVDLKILRDLMLKQKEQFARLNVLILPALNSKSSPS
jgi:hypothetical protein